MTGRYVRVTPRPPAYRADAGIVDYAFRCAACGRWPCRCPEPEPDGGLERAA